MNRKAQVLLIMLISLILFASPAESRKPNPMLSFPSGADDFIMYALTFMRTLNLTVKDLTVTGVLTAEETHIVNTTITEINVTGDMDIDGDLTTTGTIQGVTQNEFNTLTDNSIANALHRHTELVASDGSPDPALSIDFAGRVGIGTPDPDGTLELRTGNSIIRIRDTGATATATTSYIEFGGTTTGSWNRTGYVGDALSGNTNIRLRAEQGNLVLGDSSGVSVLILQGGNVITTGDITANSFNGSWNGSGNYILKTGDSDSTASTFLFQNSNWTIDNLTAERVTALGTGTFGDVDVTDETVGYKIDGNPVLWTGDPANYNLFLGEGAFDNDEGYKNIGIGYRAGYNSATGTGDKGKYNIYIGSNAGYGATGGFNNTGYWNVVIGTTAGYRLTSGFKNFFMGTYAGLYTTTGNSNFFLGTHAGYRNTVGSANLMIGRSSGFGITGSGNVFLGGYTVASEVTAVCNYNTIVGYASGNRITTGSSNIFLGRSSGSRQTTTSNLLIIDNQVRDDVVEESNSSIIYGVMADDPADQTLIFNADTTIKHNATIGTGSGQSGITMFDEVGSAVCMVCWSNSVCNNTAGVC